MLSRIAIVLLCESLLLQAFWHVDDLLFQLIFQDEACNTRENTCDVLPRGVRMNSVQSRDSVPGLVDGVPELWI